MYRALAGAVVLLLPLTAAASELTDALGKGAVQISGKDLAAIYENRTWAGKTAQGTEFSTKVSSDGTATLSFKGKDEAGKWRVAGDQGCAAYPNLRGGKEACYAIVKMPDGSYAAYDANGALNSTFAVK